MQVGVALAAGNVCALAMIPNSFANATVRLKGY
jgi:hypothetical protein